MLQQAGGRESYTGIGSAIILGGVMFGRKRKKQPDGQVCPLCQLVNTEEAESCTRCYYEFTVAAHRQVVSEITEEESGGLFDALLEEDESADDENPLVDWTSHSFSMDDMTVEVSPYDEDGLVEVDQSVSMEHQFDAPQQVARVKNQKQEEDDYVLTASDAPKNVTKFDTGDGPDLTFTKEEYSAPVVKLVEMTESEDIEPVHSTTSVLDEEDEEIEIEPAPAPAPELGASPAIAPEIPPATPAASPPPPIVPEIPAVPTIPEIPAVPAVPEVPMVPAIPETPSAPVPTPVGIWPWPQSEAWDDTKVRKMLRDAMELAKGGDIAASKRTMVSLGPHLGDRVDLVFHIGVLLKKFEQEVAMRRMIESARSQHPDSPEVAKAVQYLLA